VVAVIRQQLGHPLNTFSVKFSGNSYDESTFAAQIAKHLGTQHHELSLEQAPEGETITEILRTTDEPFGDPTLIPMTLLSQFARNYVTVVLSGDGGDELFGGYSRYAHAARIWRLRTFLLKLLSTHGLRLLTRSLSRTVQSRTLSYVLTSSGISIERLEKVIALLSTGSKQEFCMNLLKTPGAESLFRKDCKDRLTTWTTLPNLEFLELLLATDLLGYLPDDILTQADRSTMASGLELRPPLLDNQLVEYALALPLEFRALPFGKKNILRDALSQYIPRPLFDRPKHGFSVPIRQWLRGHLRGWAEQYLGPAAIERSSLLCPEKVRSIWAGHLSGKENREQLLWNVIALQRYVLESS
jgi:asparagine synthase (glutamine-hydrolysing)